MRVANWSAAADYINEMYGRGLDQPLVSFDSLTRSQPGIIEFKVYRKVLGASAIWELLDRIRAVHGEYNITGGSHNYAEFGWLLTPTRSIVCGARQGKGVYIQLKDTGS
jgi:hypothetical protein